MSGASEKRFPLKLWWRDNKEHVMLIPSGDAIETVKSELRSWKKALLAEPDSELKTEQEAMLAEVDNALQLEPATDAERLLALENISLLLELASEEKTLLAEPELMPKEEALLVGRELTSEEDALLVGRELMPEEKAPQADPELMFEVGKARQVDLDRNLGRVFMTLMPLLRNLMPRPTLKEMTLLTEPEPGLQLEKVLLPELELTLEDNALHVEPVTDTKLTLEENAQQMRLVTETETESDTELTLEENAQQMKLVAETETETETETGTETESESEPELTLQEMLMMIEPDPEMTEEEKALQVLHIVCCKEFTEYDPRKNAFVCTRFNSFNIAFFDLNEESAAILGPPLKDLPYSQWEPIEESSVNVISLKITESDVPYPINIFGTVLARDEVDYKCVYLFRRERDDSQCINSEKDMLTLTGPSRGFVVSDTMFFEINLKIKGDNITDDRDFSKGIIEHYLVPFETQPATVLLHSWLSTVGLVCEPVPYPVAVTLDVKILNGQLDVPFKGKISAGTTENTHNHIILYEYDDSKATCTHGLIVDGHLVVLTRKLVAVPRLNFVLNEEPESMIYVCFSDKDDEGKQTLVMLQYPDEEMVCSHGSYKMHLKVAWRPILTSPLHDDFEKRWRSVPMRSFMIP